MLRRSARLLLAVAALAALLGAAAGNARADGPIALLDYCKSAAPDATLTLGAGVPSVQVTSVGGQYATGLCPRFVVDITVPSNSSGGASYLPRFELLGGIPAFTPTFGLPLLQGQCSTYEGYLRVYIKGARSGQFAYIGGGKTLGVWTPAPPEGGFGPFCIETPTASYDEVPALFPPSAGTVVYRVAFAASVGSYWQTVRVKAQHDPLIS